MDRLNPLRVVTVESNRKTHSGAICFFKVSGGPPVAEIRCSDLRRPTQEELRYAALFSAATDLLEALRSIENDCGCIPPAIWELRNRAIAKAEGRDRKDQ